MKRFGVSTCKCVLDRAIEEFKKDDSAPPSVGFDYKGHRVVANIQWSNEMSCFYVLDFTIVYSRTYIVYKVGFNYPLDLALCC